MFTLFTITAANRDDHAQLVWLFRNKQFFPEWSSTPPLPAALTQGFDYRELVKLHTVGERSIFVRTRQQYTNEEFATMVIPTEDWTSRYRLSAAPNIVGSIFDPNPQLTSTFVFYELETAVTYVSPYLRRWYDSLGTKPSGALLGALNILVNGLDHDGVYGKIDLLSVVAGMETDEQRLRPLITTSGNDISLVGSSIKLDNSGASLLVKDQNLDNSHFELHWIPSLHGVNYKINDAFIGLYLEGVGQNYDMGVIDTTVANGIRAAAVNVTTSPDGTVSNDFVSVNGMDAYLQNASYFRSNFANYVANFRIDSSMVYSFISGQTSDPQSVPVCSGLPAYQMYGGAQNLVNEGTEFPQCNFMTRHRAYLTGAGSADQQKIYNRLNEFFSSRGLTT